MSIWVRCEVSAGVALTERGRVKAVGRPGDGTRNTIKGMARSSGTTLRAGIFSAEPKWISPPLTPRAGAADTGLGPSRLEVLGRGLCVNPVPFGTKGRVAGRSSGKVAVETGGPARLARQGVAYGAKEQVGVAGATAAGEAASRCRHGEPLRPAERPSSVGEASRVARD
jgi:hypothetical protein